MYNHISFLPSQFHCHEKIGRHFERCNDIGAFDVGAVLADFGGYFGHNERLASIMYRVDAATVAQALQTLNAHNYI